MSFDRNSINRFDNPLQFPTFVAMQTCAFSGGTLLAFLLGVHPRIATVGEMDGLIPREDADVYLCSCRKTIRDCEFWQAVGSAMRERGFEFDVSQFDTKCELGGPWLIRRLRKGSFRSNALDSIRDVIFKAWPRERDQLREVVARNVAFVEAVLAVTGKNVFVDSSKDRERVKYMRRLCSFDIRVIHLVRDVRGVVSSHLRRREGMSPRVAAQLWVKENRKYERFLETLPKVRSVRIRYEDLCLNPEGTLEQIYLFCGVDPFVVKDFRSGPHHIVGNRMRLSTSSEIKLDERWKSILASKQLDEIDRVASAVNRRYGYD